MRTFSALRFMPYLSRTANIAVVFVAIAVLVFLSSIGAGVRLMAGTVLVMGGNSNPNSTGMEHGLGGSPLPPGTPNNTGFPSGVPGKGYFDPNNSDSPYFGYTYQPVPWPSQFPLSTGWDGKTTFEQSQRGGLTALQTAIDAALQNGEPVTAVGYSSSANVVVRELRHLKSIGSPNADLLSFIMVAGMNRPNGGLAQRFPGLFIPFFGVKLDGSAPSDNAYETLDVSWEYDTIADFPNYPLNLLATLNALMGFTLHINYLAADLSGPRARPDYFDPESNTTYVTLAAPYLPLLLPLRLLGVPKQLIDLVEPALKVLVDLGYNRAINPGTPTPASLLPTPQRLLALPFELLDAIGLGIRRALNPGWDKVTTPDPEVEGALMAAARLASGDAALGTDEIVDAAAEANDAEANEAAAGPESTGAADEAVEVIEPAEAVEPVQTAVESGPAVEQPEAIELESELPEPTSITTRQRNRGAEAAEDLASTTKEDEPAEAARSDEPAGTTARRDTSDEDSSAASPETKPADTTGKTDNAA